MLLLKSQLHLFDSSNVSLLRCCFLGIKLGDLNFVTSMYVFHFICVVGLHQFKLFDALVKRL